MGENDSDSEEEGLAVLGGEGFTPEELARAEQQFSAQLVSGVPPFARYFGCCFSCPLICCCHGCFVCYSSCNTFAISVATSVTCDLSV